MSPIIPSRYGHPKYNIFPQKSRSASLGGFKASQRGTPGSDSKSRRKQRIEESKITVQVQEDEDGDNFFSKHLAAARFQRNHRLINVLFSDIVVDQEPPVDSDKLQVCKKRVKSLTEYQKKIDDELVELNEKFNVKRARIIDEGKKFAEKLSEVVTKSKKELETLRAAQEIRRQQEHVLKQQKAKEDAEAAAAAALVAATCKVATPIKTSEKKSDLNQRQAPKQTDVSHMEVDEPELESEILRPSFCRTLSRSYELMAIDAQQQSQPRMPLASGRQGHLANGVYNQIHASIRYRRLSI